MQHFDKPADELAIPSDDFVHLLADRERDVLDEDWTVID